MTSSLHSCRRQRGASLIEVLVAILLLSFGLLAIGAMMSFAVQAPKLAGYRALATNLAASHVDRIRANPGGFAAGAYTSALSYDATFSDIALGSSECAYPSCTQASLAAMDIRASERAVRLDLPAGGMMMRCETSPCTQASYGNLWVVWQEPGTLTALDPATSDNCPTEVTGTYTNPKPRCLYVRFKIE